MIKRFLQLKVLLMLAVIAGVFWFSQETQPDPTFFESVARRAAQLSNPQIERVWIKTPTASFTHFHDFVIHQDEVWAKPRGASADAWTVIPFEGELRGRTPVALSAGGANLCVIDDEDAVHYKKVLEEERNDSGYQCTDIAGQWNWQTPWFGLPVISSLVNAFRVSPFQLPLGYRAFAMSHLGQYAYECNDAGGQQHWVEGGTTTLFVLAENGREIWAFDPYVPDWVPVRLPVADGPQKLYEASNLAADGSLVMTIGLEATPKGFIPALYTIEWDIDNAGWHPLRTYSYFSDEADADTRLLPMPGWQRQELPELTGKAKITQAISVAQTGRGSGARELWIEGSNESGDHGYYRKPVDAEKWTFEVVPHELVGADLPRGFLNNNDLGKYWVAHRAGLKYQIDHFGPLSHQAKLTVEDAEGREYELLLYRQQSIILSSLTGREWVTYDLVQLEGESNPLTGEIRSLPVSVSFDERQSKLRMKPTWRSYLTKPRRFSLSFRSKASAENKRR